MEVIECPVNQEEFARKRSVERAFPVEGKAPKEESHLWCVWDKTEIQQSWMHRTQGRKS